MAAPIYFPPKYKLKSRSNKMSSDQSNSQDRMLKWFQYEHLPKQLQPTSMAFSNLADGICAVVEPGPECTAALRKLLEAKDLAYKAIRAAVRAKLYPGG